jgi:hypothetical protein
LNRYVPALAAFLRQEDVPFVHVRYEDLVRDPEQWMERIYEYIGVPFEAETIDYGKQGPDEQHKKGLGDPIGVRQHARPSTGSIGKWVEDLSSDPARLELMRDVIGQLDPDDLVTLGYPLETLWQPLEQATGQAVQPKKSRLTRYRLQRKIIVRTRARVQKGGLLRNLLKKVQLACDVLLRE